MNQIVELKIHQGMKEKLTNLSLGIIEAAIVSETKRMEGSKSNVGFEFDLFSEFNISEDEIVGAITMHKPSKNGGIGSTVISNSQKTLTLDSACLELVDSIVDELHKNIGVRTRASVGYTHRAIIDWVSECKLDGGTTEFVDHYLNELEISCKTQTVYIPIANLIIESEFTFGNFRFVPMSECKFDSWDTKDDEGFKRSLLNKRKRYQGYAAVVTTTVSEIEKAKEVAEQNARDAIAYLRLFNSLAMSPNERVLLTIRGEASYESQESLVERDGQLASSQTGFTEENHKWILSDERMVEIREDSVLNFQRVSSLLKKDNKTQFEEKLLYVLWLFSQCILQRDPIMKLIHLLVSLETLFLKSETAPITLSISEGLAFSTTSDTKFRREIIKVVKDCYAVRSSYIHHGNKNKVNHKDIQNILIYSLMAYSNILNQSNSFRTKDEFLDAIDNTKYS